MKVTTTKHKSRLTANVADLVADYKARGMDQQAAWRQLIKDRALRPGIDFKAMVNVYNQVTAKRLETVQTVTFEATHHDNIMQLDCNITVDDNGVFKILWANGSTGSNPPIAPPDPERFVPLT